MESTDHTNDFWTDDDEVEDSNYVEPRRNQRESDIFVKKKVARPILDSDSESDNPASQSLLHIQNNTTKLAVESDSEEDELPSEYYRHQVSKHTINFDSEEDESPSERSRREIQENAVTKRIDSVIDDFQPSEDDVEDSLIEQANSSDSDSLHSIYDESFEEEVKALSRRISRLSSEFQLEKTGVFNSTADLPRKNTPNNRGAIETPNEIDDKDTAEKKSSNINNENRSGSLKNQSEKKTSPTNPNEQTPKNILQRRRSPYSSDAEQVDRDSDVIEVSTSEDESPVKTPLRTINTAMMRQQKLHDLLSAKKATPVVQPKQPKPEVNILPLTQQFKAREVTRTEYEAKKLKVQKMANQVLQLAQMMRTLNMTALPDNGQSLKDRHKILELECRRETEAFNRMVVTKEDQPGNEKNPALLAWEDIQAGAGVVLPKTFGAKAISTHNAQKALTMERLQQLHSSLQTCPKESDFEKDPPGLKVELMTHQRRALAWLMWREAQKPSGGILADDMGLGKTLTMIALILKMLDIEKGDLESDDEENQPERKNFKRKGGTLIICPASLLEQWSGEIDRRLKRGRISYTLFHGPKREDRPKRLAEYDVVITTYSVANIECNKNGVLYKIKWRRIVLDEAHQIRNHRAQMTDAACRLSAKSRWALTGTPVHNKALDMYSLLRFLRCSPFDELPVWKKWVGEKSSGGTERLHTVISSLLLRRTKDELMAQGSLQSMPERKWELISVKLREEEMKVYQKILIFSRTLFAQFLYQRAEKNQDVADMKQLSTSKPGEEYFKMRSKLLKLNKVKDVSQHEILVLLLRLRQICNHPSLIKNMLDSEAQDLEEDDEKADHMDLLDQLNKLNIDDDNYNPDVSAEGLASNERVTLKSASKGFFNPSNPVFDPDFRSSKIVEVLKVIKQNVLSRNDKAVVVSQWPTYLRLIAKNLKDEGIKYDILDGSVPVPKRMTMVDTFNNPNSRMRIMLLSLTAGGVGLNLVGGNHLVLLDLHWNPQLECQAQDRIYRMGQEKPVFVYKFMAVDTIEVRIKELQDRKMDIAKDMLSGTKQVIENKLSIQDLRRLFDM